MKTVCELLLVGIFLFPLGVLLSHFDILHFPAVENVIPFLSSAVIQGVLSGVCSVVMGTAVAMGLIYIQSDRRRQSLEVFFLIPSLVPGIFVVLAILEVYSFMDMHPMGYIGVVSANVMTSFGLVGVFLSRALIEKVGGFAELARIEGATANRTLTTLLPLLWRDLLSMFLAVFIFSFLGFSVPLALGGLQAATLEVQIYRKVIGDGAIAEALALSLLQFAFIALCAQLMPLKNINRRARSVNISFLGGPLLLLATILFTAILLVAPMAHFFSGAVATFKNEFLSDLLLKGSAATFFIALCAGFFTLALGVVATYLWPPLFIGRFFFAYSAPSAVLIGFGFYLLGYHLEGLSFQVVALGVILAIFFWPALYRLAFYRSAKGLQGQIEIALQMGASSAEIFKIVTWPQLRGTVCAMAALAALWAAGDFGISSMLATDDSTLSLLVKNLISRYHLPEATFILGILIFVGFLAASTFLGLYRVIDRKSTLQA